MPRRVRAWTVSRPPGNTPAVSFFGGSQNSEAGAGQGRGLSCLIIPCRTSEGVLHRAGNIIRSEEHTSELQSLMRISYAVFCLKKKNKQKNNNTTQITHHLNYFII